MTATEILRLRLANQRLAHAGLRQPEDVVAWFGAVQAQDYLGALWALGLRLRKSTEGSVEAALARRALIRCWPMRGTLHFVAADDARWLTRLLAPRVLARNAARMKREVDLDAAVIGRSREIVQRTLEGGRQAERAVLYAALEAGRIRTGGSRGLHILLWLAMEGLICLTGRAGKQHTFALLDEWIPTSRAFERDAALAELAGRYFGSHGPATWKDFAWWAGIALRDAEDAVDAARPRLVRETHGGQVFWWRAARAAPRPRPGPLIKLLPAYDEYTVAYKDRSSLVEPAARRMGAGHGLLGPVVLVNGRIAGSWKRTLEPTRVRIETKLVRVFTRLESDALLAATRDFGAFVGLEAVLRKAR